MNSQTDHTTRRETAFAGNPPTGEAGFSRQACRASAGKSLSGKAVICVTTSPGIAASAQGLSSPTNKRTTAMTRPLFFYGLLVLLLLGVAACGGADTPPDTAAPAAGQDGLSQAQLENGIGPITKVDLPTALDAAKVAQGEEIFTTKCAVCHKLTERFTAPPLGDVLSHRTPAFILNMMLNPDEMVQKHPEVKALLAEYFVPMPNQNLTEDEARAVLEYLRDNQTETAAAQ